MPHLAASLLIALRSGLRIRRWALCWRRWDGRRGRRRGGLRRSRRGGGLRAASATSAAARVRWLRRARGAGCGRRELRSGRQQLVLDIRRGWGWYRHWLSVARRRPPPEPRHKRNQQQIAGRPDQRQRPPARSWRRWSSLISRSLGIAIRAINHASASLLHRTQSGRIAIRRHYLPVCVCCNQQ